MVWMRFLRSILHIGSIAGVPQELSAAQRRMGLKSDILSFEPNTFGYSVDIYHPIELRYSSAFQMYAANPIRLTKKMPVLLKLVEDYDILHFHYSSGIPLGLDFPIWKAMGKRAIIHHHGSDIRNKGEGKLYSTFADAIIVSTPDLLEWSKEAIWVPNPLDLSTFPCIPVLDETKAMRIVHAPSSRQLKGTDHVLKAVKALEKEGYNIDFRLIEGLPHSNVIEEFKKADIVIDQLLIGWYGMVSQECMALGKPVCVYVRKDLEGHMPFNPFCNTSPDTIREDLRNLIDDPRLRRELSIKGRRYVKQVHDPVRVVEKLSRLYG
jgi:glycosyltransferase involved in cell wall biosynthesis